MDDVAAYGSTLDAFPELFRQIHVWTADPQVGGGYSPQAERIISGIFLDSNNNALLRRHIGAGYAIDAENQDILWVPSDVDISVGLFLHHPDDGTVHRVVASLDKSLPGGFRRYLVERVGGANGLNQENIPIREGTYI